MLRELVVSLWVLRRRESDLGSFKDAFRSVFERFPGVLNGFRAVLSRNETLLDRYRRQDSRQKGEDGQDVRSAVWRGGVRTGFGRASMRV